MLRTLLLAIFLALPAPIAQANVADTIRALAPNALVHVVGEAGQTLVSQNADRPFVPASVAKIATAWLAMEVLGHDYRFQTSFYVDANRVLYVRGGGDPLLVSEELAILAQRLVDAAGTAPFSTMVLDTRHFPDRITIPGVGQSSEAYNAPNAALSANFNTIHAVRDGDSVRSAEAQTPITPLAIAQFREHGPNGPGRISLEQGDPHLSALYAGELIAAFIGRSGGSVQGGMTLGQVPEGLAPLYVHRQSRPLYEIVRVMMAYSNNYIANQIFLQAGVVVTDNPVSLRRSQAVLGALLERHRLSDDITMVEGSGISRQNRMTARGLAALLTQFAPYARLMESTARGSYYKTGTLNDVGTLAGYAQTQQHGLVRFVIALPGGGGKLRFSVLEAIEEGL